MEIHGNPGNLPREDAKTHRLVAALQHQRQLRHQRPYQACEIMMTGLLRIPGMAFTSKDCTSSDEFKDLLMMMPYDAFLIFPLLRCLYQPFSLCFGPLKAYCGPTSYLA